MGTATKQDKTGAKPVKKGVNKTIKGQVGADLNENKPVKASGGRREGSGRPVHKPTEHNRNLVIGAIASGACQKALAISLKISVKTMIKHYRKELDKGYEIDQAEMSGIGKAMAMKAIDDPKYIPAFALYVRGKYGFVDKTQLDHVSSDGTMATKAPILLMPE